MLAGTLVVRGRRARSTQREVVPLGDEGEGGPWPDRGRGWLSEQREEGADEDHAEASRLGRLRSKGRLSDLYRHQPLSPYLSHTSLSSPILLAPPAKMSVSLNPSSVLGFNSACLRSPLVSLSPNTDHGRTRSSSVRSPATRRFQDHSPSPSSVRCRSRTTMRNRLRSRSRPPLPRCASVFMR